MKPDLEEVLLEDTSPAGGLIDAQEAYLRPFSSPERGLASDCLSNSDSEAQRGAIENPGTFPTKKPKGSQLPPDQDSTRFQQNFSKRNLRVQEALSDHFSDLVFDQGRVPYFVTTTYRDPLASPLNPTRAKYFFNKFHFSFLSYLAGSKKLQRPYFKAIEPVIYAFLDVPGSKPKHYRVPSRKGGGSSYHYHSIVLVDPSHRTKMDRLCDAMHASVFLELHGDRCHLKTIDVRQIQVNEKDIHKVARYCSHHAIKSFGDDRWEDSCLFFPKAAGEL